MSRKGKQGRFETLGTALRRLVESRFGERMREYEAVRVWPEAVGAEIARRTVALGIKSGILHVLVSTKVWLTQLTILKRKLKDKVNEKLGEEVVTDIRFIEKVEKVPKRRK